MNLLETVRPLPLPFEGIVTVFNSTDQVLLPEETLFLPKPNAALMASLKSALSRESWLLVPGWSAEESMQPGEDPQTGCLARVVSHDPAQSADPLFCIKGMARVLFLPGQVTSTGCPLVAVRKVAESGRPVTLARRQQLRQEILQRLLELHPELNSRDLTLVLRAELPLGQLCDLASGPLNLTTAERRQILREQDVEARCSLLLEFSREEPLGQFCSHPLVELN